MFNFGYLLLAAAAIVAATAMPANTPRTIDLSEMINNTVCAIEVKINEDLNRIPQRIKMMKCATKTDQWCVENNITPRDCCHHSKNQKVMECVEMTDTVLVFYKDKNESMPLDVSVGCSCVIGHSTVAPSPPGF